MSAHEFQDLGLRIAYDGSAFAGFQLQSSAVSVQGEVERALSTLLRTKVRISFTSRTDAGVHAYDQWIFIRDGLSLYEKLSETSRQRFLFSFNALVQPHICGWQLLALRRDFHPKKSVNWKEYQYEVFWSPVMDPLARQQQWWIRGPLDLNNIRRNLKLICGTHDFSGFSKQSGHSKKDTIRTLLRAELECKRHPVLRDSTRLILIFRGTGFLHHMVRNIVGSLIESGLGKRIDFKEVLMKRDRRQAGVNAPPQPLILVKTKVSPKYYRLLSGSATHATGL